MGSLSVAASDGGVDQQYWRAPPSPLPAQPYLSTACLPPSPLLGCTENFNIPFHSLNAASRYLMLVKLFEEMKLNLPSQLLLLLLLGEEAESKFKLVN